MLRAHSSSKKPGFMEPTNGLQYYEDVYNHPLPYNGFETRADYCESEDSEDDDERDNERTNVFMPSKLKKPRPSQKTGNGEIRKSKAPDKKSGGIEKLTPTSFTNTDRLSNKTYRIAPSQSSRHSVKSKQPQPKRNSSFFDMSEVNRTRNDRGKVTNEFNMSGGLGDELNGDMTLDNLRAGAGAVIDTASQTTLLSPFQTPTRDDEDTAGVREEVQDNVQKEVSFRDSQAPPESVQDQVEAKVAPNAGVDAGVARRSMRLDSKRKAADEDDSSIEQKKRRVTRSTVAKQQAEKMAAKKSVKSKSEAVRKGARKSSRLQKSAQQSSAEEQVVKRSKDEAVRKGGRKSARLQNGKQQSSEVNWKGEKMRLSDGAGFVVVKDK